MTFDNMPDALSTRLRVSILASIYNGEKDFNTLKKVLGVTDGNLSVQLSNLEGYGCVTIKKSILDKRSHTVCTITEYGRELFSEYVEMLTRAVE